MMLRKSYSSGIATSGLPVLARATITEAPMEEAVRLCKFDDLNDREARGFAVDGLRRKVVIVRKNGRAYGYLDSCPHYAGGTPMAWKTNAYLDDEGGLIACHSHGALVEIETGDCILGPCLGQSLRKIFLTIDVNGWILAYLDEHTGG